MSNWSEYKGLGDLVAKLTNITGVDVAVKKVAKAAGVEDCGCTARQEALNKAVPFNKNKSKA